MGYWEESESLGQPKTNKERERKKEQSWCVQRTTRKIGAGVIRAHFHQCVVIVRQTFWKPGPERSDRPGHGTRGGFEVYARGEEVGVDKLCEAKRIERE